MIQGVSNELMMSDTEISDLATEVCPGVSAWSSCDPVKPPEESIPRSVMLPQVLTIVNASREGIAGPDSIRDSMSHIPQ